MLDCQLWVQILPRQKLLRILHLLANSAMIEYANYTLLVGSRDSKGEDWPPILTCLGKENEVTNSSCLYMPQGKLKGLFFCSTNTWLFFQILSFLRNGHLKTILYKRNIHTSLCWLVFISFLLILVHIKFACFLDQFFMTTAQMCCTSECLFQPMAGGK